MIQHVSSPAYGYHLFYLSVSLCAMIGQVSQQYFTIWPTNFFIFLIEILPPLPFELKDTINILLILFSWSIPYIRELFSPNYFTLGPAPNDLLRKIGIKNKYMCTFWEAELENLTHLF